MKHWLCALLTLAMALSLCACEKKPQEEHREDPAAVRQEDSKLPPQDSPWGGSVPVDKTFERIAGAAEARLTSGQELLLLDFMDRYYRTLQDLRQVDIRDLCASAEEAAFQHCVWNSICTIRGAALEDLTLRGYSFDLAVKSVDRQDDDHLTVTVLENNVQYFTALLPLAEYGEELVQVPVLVVLPVIVEVIVGIVVGDMVGDDPAVSDEALNVENMLHRPLLRGDVPQMNYGSQVLMAGGIPADKSGAKEQCWYNNGGYDLAVSFINVGGFLDYAAANTGAGLVARVGAAYYTGQVHPLPGMRFPRLAGRRMQRFSSK